MTPPTGSGFRAVHPPRRHRWPVAAVFSILFALAGFRYALHNWHHPDSPLPFALPLLGIAILLGAWNRFGRRAR